MMTRGINKITIFIFRFVIVNTNRLEALKESVKYQFIKFQQWHEAPDGFYEECKALIDEVAIKTDAIWNKYEKIIPNCKTINI